MLPVTVEPLRGGPELRAGSLRHAAVHREPEQVLRLLRVRIPQRRPAQRDGRLQPEGAAYYMLLPAFIYTDEDGGVIPAVPAIQHLLESCCDYKLMIYLKI